MPSLDEYERIATLLPKLTEEELVILRAWEKQHVTGDGRFSSSDWPGWQAVIKRLQH